MGLKEAEEAFAAALLQDMAIPLLAKELPADYTLLLNQRDGGKRRLSDLERERFGWTHAEAAAEMARNWNLPKEFASLVSEHTMIDELLAETSPAPLQAAVALSALLPAAHDNAWVEAPGFDQAFQRWRPANGPSLAEFLTKVDHEFAEFAPVLKIAKPTKSLVECYQEAMIPA
jgi:HD-like signal output (HDOD) protein